MPRVLPSLLSYYRTSKFVFHCVCVCRIWKFLSTIADWKCRVHLYFRWRLTFSGHEAAASNWSKFTFWFLSENRLHSYRFESYRGMQKYPKPNFSTWRYTYTNLKGVSCSDMQNNQNINTTVRGLYGSVKVIYENANNFRSTNTFPYFIFLILVKKWNESPFKK